MTLNHNKSVKTVVSQLYISFWYDMHSKALSDLMSCTSLQLVLVLFTDLTIIHNAFTLLESIHCMSKCHLCDPHICIQWN